MATSTINLGSLPVTRGAYAGDANYYKENEVTMYGMTFRAKTGTVETPLTGYAPAQLNGDSVVLINTDKWTLTAGNPDTYDIVAETNAAIQEMQEDIAEFDDRKANKDGYYEQMAVGIAKNLEGRNDVTDSFMERTTGGDAEVANGLAQLTEVAGKSQVWNQMIVTSHFSLSYDNSQSASNYYITISDVRDYRERIGHKVFGKARLKNTGGDSDGVTKVYLNDLTQQNLLTASWQIFTASVGGSTTSGRTLIATIPAGKNAKYDIDSILIDLTLLGIDNLTTVEEVEAWLAENIGLREYYPYNAGEVLNNKMKGLESLGFNLLDPSTGKARIVGAYSDVYGNYYGITGTHGTLTFTSDLGETSEITPDSDGKFLLEEPGWLDVATPGADCAVFLWWDGTQTDYQPYERNTGDLDVTHIYGKLNGTGELVQVFPDGMAGVGTAKDVLRIEDGVTVVRKRIGKVDLGSRNYSESSDTGVGKYYNNIATFKPGTYNILCTKYPIGNTHSFELGKITSYSSTTTGRIQIQDSAFAGYTTAQVKSALSGVMLFYELATEELYTDLVYQGSSLFVDGTPVELPVNYRVNNWGIERMIPQNDSDVVTTFPELTCRYSIDAVEQLNTHTDEIEDLYEGLDELDEKKPNKSGSYPGMAVGSAKAIEGDDTKVEDFTFTPIQCADGLAQIKDVRGKSLVMNQLLANFRVSSCTSTESDGIITITPSSGSNRYQANNGGLINTLNGHKYLQTVIVKSDGTISVGFENYGSTSNGITNIANKTSSSSFTRLATIAQATADAGCLFQLRTTSSSEPYQIIKDSFMCIDLTLMFGAGNEPATVEEFEKMFPLPYYAYNAGSLLNNNTEQIESVGFNQWDEEWEQGSYDVSTGRKRDAEGYIRSKNAFRVSPGATYCFTKGAARSMRVLQYDGAGNYIGYLSPATAAAFAGFTLADNAYKIRFHVAGITYNNDVCINLSDPSRNGTYEPYKKDTVELNLPTLTGKLNGEGESVVVAPDGARSAGTAYDEFVVENGYITKFIKRLGYVASLKELTWAYITNISSPYTFPYFASYDIQSDAKAAQYGLNSKGYAAKTIFANDKALYINNSKSILITDSSYTDATTFKNSLENVGLVYELDTPLTYILDTPIPATFQAYKGGTLKQLPENTSTPTTAPMVMENVYAIDVLSVIQSLPKNYISAESMHNLLAAMQSAGIFTAYTMTYNSETQKYQFTFDTTQPESNE